MISRWSTTSELFEGSGLESEGYKGGFSRQITPEMALLLHHCEEKVEYEVQVFSLVAEEDGTLDRELLKTAKDAKCPWCSRPVSKDAKQGWSDVLRYASKKKPK